MKFMGLVLTSLKVHLNLIMVLQFYYILVQMSLLSESQSFCQGSPHTDDNRGSSRPNQTPLNGGYVVYIHVINAINLSAIVTERKKELRKHLKPLRRQAIYLLPL